MLRGAESGADTIELNELRGHAEPTVNAEKPTINQNQKLARPPRFQYEYKVEINYDPEGEL